MIPGVMLPLQNINGVTLISSDRYCKALRAQHRPEIFTPVDHEIMGPKVLFFRLKNSMLPLFFGLYLLFAQHFGGIIKCSESLATLK